MTTGCGKLMDKMKGNFRKLENCDDDEGPEGEEPLPLDLTHLTPALLEEARTSLHETEEVKQKALAELRRMIAGEKNLSCPVDDLFLLMFLRSRKYKVEKSFKLLQNYFKFRREFADIYEALDVEQSMDLLRRDFVGFLMHRDRKGCVVFIAKFELWDPDIDSYESVFRIVTALLVFTQVHEATHIAGFRGIFDFRGVTWKHIKFFTPANALLAIRSTQSCYPARYKQLHVICDSKLFNIFWKMVKPLLTSKLRKRIIFHFDDLKPIQQYIHPSVLPEEFGGEAPTFCNKSLMDLAYSHADRIISQLQYGYKV